MASTKLEIDWNSIDTVLLDMDGTLLDLHFDSHFWLEHMPSKYAKKKNMTLDDAKDELFPMMQDHQGELEWYCLDFWSRKVGLDIPKLKEDVQDLIKIRPFVVEFLAEVRTSGRRLIMVTNAHRKSLVLKMRKTGIDTHFDAIVSAHDYGVPKEKQRFWEILDRWHTIDRQATLLIDDSLPVLRSGKKYGIAHLLAIKCPDSKAPPKPGEEFIALDSFRDLLPVS